MNPPPFAVQTPAGHWVLKNDFYTPKVIESGKLLCDCKEMWDWVMGNLPETGGLIIDVGAFEGETASYFDDYGYEVAAFEPRPDAFWCLMQNCSPDLYHLYNLALGDGGRVTMPFQDSGMLGSRRLHQCTEGEVQTYRLDDFHFEDVALLKIDVEGMEPLVLKGAQELIAREHPPVMVEYNVEALAAHGFEPMDISQHFPEPYRGYMPPGQEGEEKLWDRLFLYEP